MYQVIPDSGWFFSTISLFNNVVNNNLTKKQTVAAFHVCLEILHNVIQIGVGLSLTLLK
jgi:hypothetical protein